jgi:crotonobetainyl-CoA:carnitine CoA-transferase CaiB-like acyl-CoA transferase
MKQHVLGGLKVVDFGQGIAGPYCGALLGDFGADVVKVEPPRGDWGRTMGAKVGPSEGASFIAVNRNKRSVCLDLTTADGLALAQELADWADVVIQSFRPGVMQRYGLDSATLRARRPKLIYCSVTGFGESGPSADLPAGDSTMQAYGGLMSIIGGPGQDPTRVGNVVSDMMAGMHAFEGVLLALLDQRSTGRGASIQINLLDTMVAFQAPTLSEFLVTGKLPPRSGNEHPLIAPSGSVRTADSSLVYTILEHQWAAFCATMGLPDLASDGRFRKNQDRLANREALNALLAPLFSAGTTAQWIERFNAAGVTCAPINDYEALRRDPQVQHNRLIGSIEHPVLGPVPHIANPVRIDTQTAVRHPAPQLAAHTASVLADVLGHNAEVVAAWAEAGALVAADLPRRTAVA